MFLQRKKDQAALTVSIASKLLLVACFDNVLKRQVSHAQAWRLDPAGSQG